MKPVKGFTLIELMIVVAIIAILASIAMPAYNSYVLRGKFAEAASSLAGTRVKMEQYYQDQRTYAAVAGVPDPCVAPATVNFTVSCTNVTATTYTVQAVGIAGKGTGGFTFTLNQDNVKTTAAVPTGWTVPGSNCWVQKKGGIC
jgi:type IV pilus assembly protein PilE